MDYIHYPSSIDELIDGNKYQILFPMSKLWGEIKTYDSNICNSQIENLKYLISKKRLRILKR